MNTSTDDIIPTIPTTPTIQQAADDLKPATHPVVDMLTAKAQKIAQHSVNLAYEAKGRAEQSLKHATCATTNYVSEQPMRSILLAAGVGAGVALLAAVARQRSHNRPKTRY